MSTPPETATNDNPTPQPPKRRGMQGNAKSMVLSMIACIAGCLVLLALIPRQGATKLATVDAAGVAGQVSQSKKWDVAVADGLGSPWRPVHAAMIPGDKENPERWRAGYQGAGEHYLSIQQRKDGGAAWFAKVAKGTNSGELKAGGATWRKVEMDGDQKALVRTTPLAGLDTVVTGKGTWNQLEQVAKSAKPISAVTK